MIPGGEHEAMGSRARIWRVLALGFLALLATARHSSAEQGASRSEASLEELFRQAQAASHENNYAGAEKLYRQILSADPGVLAARVNLGLALYWQHKSRDALAELEKALRVSPKEFSALLFCGLTYLDLGEYDRAEKMLRSAARVKDMDPLLFWGLGSLAMMHGDSNAALAFLERSVALDPNNARAVWLLGQAYARLAYRKETAKVPADYTSLVEQTLQWVEQTQPNSALSHVFRGDVLAARNLPTEALAEYQKALKIDPNWPDIHLLIGSLLGLEGRWDEAVAELEKELEDFPQDPRALLEIGTVYCHAGNYGAALPYLQQAVARDAENYETHYRLGEAYVNLRKYAWALPQLQQATRLNPEKSEPYYLLHRAYRALNETKKAAWALKQFNLRKEANQ